MKFIKRMVIKWRLILAKRQLAYMEERIRQDNNRMGSLELFWLHKDIDRQQNIIYGHDLQLIKLDLDDNETEALSSNSVSPLFRRH